MPGQLSSLLHRAGRWVLLTEAARAVCSALAVVGAAALLAILLDAFLALPPSLLLAGDVALLALVGAGAVYIGFRIYRQLFNPRHLARLIENRVGVHDSRLINAVDLSSNSPRAASAAFVTQSINRGETLASGLSPRAAVNPRPLRKAILGVGAALAIALAIHLALPGMFSAVLRRYWEPNIMHPPFTLLKFAVTVSPETVYHGKSASIVAKITGPGVPDRASVVFVNAASPAKDSQPMLRSDESTTRDKVFVLPIDRAENTRRFYIDAPGGRSEMYTLAVMPVPVFEFLNVRYDYPEYTGWGSATRSLGDDGIRAIQGTQVIVTAGSNLPLRDGLITLTLPDQSAPPVRVRMEPSPDDPATVIGRFGIASDARFDMVIFAKDGTSSDEHRQGPVSAIPDGPPFIEFTEPTQHVVVPEEYPVNVAIAARDDVAVDRITLSRSINGWGPSTVEVALLRDRQTQATAAYEFDLPTLGAHAGDVITYFATAYDNHPTAAQSADTATYVIEVISKEEYLEFARTQYQMDEIAKEAAAFNRRLDELKFQREDILKQLEPLKDKAAQGQELSEADQQKMRELEDALKKYQEQAAQLAKDMKERGEQPQTYDFEKPWQDMLKSMADDVQRQADNAQQTDDAMKQAQQQPSSASNQQMAAAAEKFKKDSAPFEDQAQQERQQTAQDMQKMKLADDMVAQAERVRQVILQQRDLADRMAELKDKEKLSPADELRAHRLAEEQDQLREQLGDACEKLQQAAEKSQDQLPKMSGQAKKICQAISDMGVESDQKLAAEAAKSGFGPEAHEAADQAAKNLEKLLSDCNSDQMQQQASEELDGCLKMPKDGMRQSMKQMAQSRNIPGMGKKNGQGSGFAGSQARMTVMGPPVPHKGTKSDAKNGVAGRADSTSAATNGTINNENSGTETLDPQNSGARTTAAAAMAGVPVQYRDQAEAYFRRLAEEARKKRGDQ